MSIVTDSKGINEPKDTNTPLFQLYSLFLDESGQKELKDRFASPGLSYGNLKIELFECFWNRFEPFRQKRDYLASHKDFVLQKLKEGAEKSSTVADRFLNKAREAMGLNYGEVNV